MPVVSPAPRAPSAATDAEAGGPGRKRARILIIGGCDVHLRIDLMRVLSRDYDVSAAGSEPRLSDAFDRAGFPYHVYPLGRGLNPAEDLRTLRALGALIRRLAPDVVHTFATKPSVWGRIAGRWAGVRVIVGTVPGLGSLYTTNSLLHRWIRGAYEGLQRYAADVSHMTIFQNSADLAEFRRAGVVREHASTLIRGSGVRTEHFHPAGVSTVDRAIVGSEFRSSPSSMLVTMITRVIRSKGVMEFAAAAERIRARHPGVDFLLVGPDDRDSIDRLLPDEVAYVKKHLRWPGSRPDIRAILGVSDLFVLPSYYREGIPRVLLEAAAMGLPLITTDTPGCNEVVDDGRNGIVVPPRSVDRLVDAIERMIADPVSRREFGAASRKIALERFDLELVARQTAELYESLLNGG